MNTFRRAFSLAAVALVLLAGRASAQTADSLGWAWVANLGYVQTTGNTSLTTINAGEKLSYRPDLRWTFTNTGTLVYGKTSGVESANQAFFGLRADYQISPHFAAFGLVNYDRNPFAGITRRFEELVGLTATLVATPRQVLTVDAGVGNNQQLTGGLTSSFFVARLAPTYRYNLTGKAYLEEAVSLLENLEDTGDLRTASLTSLVAPLSGRISLRVSYLMRYDAEPEIQTAPSTFYRKLDTIFTTGIQLTL
jgi:putative salt-induced outer membrane protein